MFKRVIVKLSGEALFGDSGNNFDSSVISDIISQIKHLIELGVQVSLVVGGGNYWRGRDSAPSMDRTMSDQIGMLATVMNAIYLSDAFSSNDVKSVVMTPFTVGSMTELFSKTKAISYISEGYVAIFAGGIGHPFFSTDTITALRAAELEADAILYAKNIDGVYDSDPKVNPNAIKFDSIKCDDIIKNTLKVIDLSAASICSEQKIPVVIFALNEKDNIIKAAKGEKVGTYVYNE